MGQPITSVDSNDSNDSTFGGISPMATRNTADFEAIGLRLINPWEIDGRNP